MFKINNLAGGVTEVEILDVITEAGPLLKELKQIKGEISILINSPGGSVFDGMAIYNYLNSIKDRVTVTVIGLAASIASIIALGGKRLVMYQGTFLMIHNPSVRAWGGSEDLRKSADIMDKVRGEIVKIYQTKATLTDEEISSMMDAETWLTADECLEKGFCDEVILQTMVACAIKNGQFKNLPEVLKVNMEVVPEATPEPEPEPVPEKPAVIAEPEAQEPIQKPENTSSLFSNEQENEMPQKTENQIDLSDIANSQRDSGLTDIKNVLISKPQNAALTLSDGYGVPTAVGGEILRNRDKGSFFRSAGVRNIKVSTLTALTFNPNNGAAEVITGNYTDLTSTGAKITATPSKVGGRYLAKEEVNDFSVLNVLDNFKTDASRAVVKGENTILMDKVIAKAGVTNVAAGDWTQAKIAAVYAGVGSDYLGSKGAWFINAASLPALMAVQTNGAGSPLLFEPVYISDDGRVGHLMGQPVFVHASVPTIAAGTKKGLWYVAMDACVLVDFLGGNLRAEAGKGELTNDLYINFAEYMFFDVADVAGVVSLTWV